ncbi:class I SAM-dependent methyltransferase [Sessilibacter sp. MAH4]
MLVQICPLCGAVCSLFHQDKRRSYFICAICSLVHVPKEFHLTDNQEREEYDKHENSLTDVGYRQFLTRAAEPLLGRLQQKSYGLDFGCGPAPMLAKILSEYGHTVELFDKFYYPNNTILDNRFDFIVTTEVVEHLADPALILDTLFNTLKVGGFLVIMTKRWLDLERFKSWHYKNDPTHITYFHEKTLQWIANFWRAELEFVAADVVVLTKK